MAWVRRGHTLFAAGLLTLAPVGCADLVGADFDGLRMREPGPPGAGGTSAIHEGGADGPITGTTNLPSQRIVSDRGELDFLGVSVAVQGDVALIGTRDPGWAGRVLVARALEGSWALTGEELDAGEFRAPGARFGATVALSGSWAIVGAPGNDDEEPRPGEAHFFERVAGRFEHRGRVQAPAPSNDDWFGGAVVIDGNVAVVGAPGIPGDLTSGSPGAVHVFRRNDRGAFALAESLRATGESAAPDSFGMQLALFGTSLAIGAPLRNDQGTNAGAVFSADDLGGGFRIRQVILSGTNDPAADRFGDGAIGLGSGVLLVPAWGSHVEAFDRPTDVLWGADELLPPPGHPLAAGFGWRTAVHDDRALVCARYGKQGRGSALLYRRARGAWQYQRELWSDLVPPESGAEKPPLFGWSVAFDGTTAVISALLEDDPRGAVYFFQIPP